MHFDAKEAIEIYIASMKMDSQQQRQQMFQI
jgi:hypothetical protein